MVRHVDFCCTDWRTSALYASACEPIVPKTAAQNDFGLPTGNLWVTIRAFQWPPL